MAWVGSSLMVLEALNLNISTNVALAYNVIIYECFVLQIMQKYTKTKVIRLTEVQHQTLKKMQSYNVDVADFIRNAISEKIKKDYNDLIPKPKKQYCPF